jgi:ketosteroid isomerase-like protein
MGPQDAAQETLQVILRFNDCFVRRDVDGIMALTAPGGIFENTYPPPDGERYVGLAAIRAFWEDLFSANNHPRFEFEDVFAAGERGVARWTYSWQNPDGSRGHIRGVDVFRVRDGKVVEKLSYVKG